ncbi:MAG TPA: lasso peptide biosynthesis B2 protein [Herpetosiphonaceae bacterium]
MSRLRNWLALPLADRWLLLWAWLLLGAIRVGLWLLPFRTVQVLVSARRFPARSDHPSRAAIERIGWAVAVASAYVPRASCLPQALTAQALLRRQGYPAQVRIGVARADGRLEAHAWAECAGEIVIGGSAETLARYTPLPSLPMERHHGAS